jgi:cytochrome c
MRRTAVVIVLSATLGLAGCSGGSSSTQDQAGSSPTPAAAEASPAESGPSLASAPASFAMCSSCHTIRPGMNAVGPSLFGVFGRKAATGAGYAYSDAMKASGKTWDEATLDTYLTAPMKDVPGTKMTFAGQSDPAKRKEIIEFLKTVK